MLSGSFAQKGQSKSRILVTDFDGTMTRHGFLEIVKARFPAEGSDPWDEYMTGKKTHFEVVSAIFSRIRAKADELETMLREMELDPALPKAIRRLEEAGWKVVVASAGCNWYIQRLLKGADLSLMVYANPGYYHPQQGLVMTMPEPSGFTTLETGTDKLAVVKKALTSGAEVAYAGDGRPDLESILAVHPSRRFARKWLANHLRQIGQNFHPFDSWNDIASCLTAPEEVAVMR